MTISETELEFMQYLWQCKSGAAFQEIMKYFNEVKNKNWQKQTVNTYLLRLGKKGFIISKNITLKKKIYLTAISEGDYKKNLAKEVLNESYGGSLKDFVVSLSGGDGISKNDADELIEFLKSK